jgi:hypothetical protein
MALIDPTHVTAVYTDGNCSRTVLYSLRNVTAGDTADLSGQFTVVKRAGIVSDTASTIGACSISGTVITVPAGPSADGIWLLAVGVAAG